MSVSASNTETGSGDGAPLGKSVSPPARQAEDLEVKFQIDRPMIETSSASAFARTLVLPESQNSSVSHSAQQQHEHDIELKIAESYQPTNNASSMVFVSNAPKRKIRHRPSNPVEASVEEYQSEEGKQYDSMRPNVSGTPSGSPEVIRNYTKTVFECPHKSHQCANFNIYIDKQRHTQRYLSQVRGGFETPTQLYYYMNMSTALQLNDKQMFEYAWPHARIVISNWDLICSSTGDVLYSIIVPNNKPPSQHPRSGNDLTKWLWQLDGLMSAQQIMQHYGILRADLPRSSRQWFDQLLRIREPSNDSASCQAAGVMRVRFEQVDWRAVRQVRRKDRSKKSRVYKQSVDRGQLDTPLRLDTWLDVCRRGWDRSASMPVLVMKNGNKGQQGHWCEWVKFVRLPTGEFVGVSCKCVRTDETETWRVQSICMDLGDLINKHRLLLPTKHFGIERYAAFLNGFNQNWVGIKFI